MSCLRWLLPVCATGCLHDDLVPCGDTVCPIGRACDVDRSVCVEPNGLSVPPAAVTFPALPCGMQDQQPLAVHNFSDHAIAFTAVSTTPEISVTPAMGVFPAGETLQLQVVAAAPAHSVPGSAIDGSVLLATSDGVIERPVQLTTFGAVLDASLSKLDFGEATTGVTSGSRSVTFTNSGNADVSLALALTEVPQTDPLSFMLGSTAVDVPAGASSDVGITFAPQGATTPYPYSAELGVAIAGTLCAPPPDQVTTSGLATMDDIIVDHLAMDFGTQHCNAASASQVLVLTNNLPTTQSLAVSLTGDKIFTVTGPSTVGAQSSVQFTVMRGPIPTSFPVGMIAGMLTIMAPGPPAATKKIALSDFVKAPVLTLDQTSLEVSMSTYSTTSRVLTLTNSGNDIANVSISPSSFMLPGGGRISLNGSVQVQPQSTAMVTMSFVSGTQTNVCADIVFTDPNACSDPIVLGFVLNVM